MVKKPVLYPILTLFILGSCQKDQSTPVNTPQSQSDISSTSILIGDSTGLLHIEHNETFVWEEEGSIDINGDSMLDFSFLAEYFGGQWLGNPSRAYINCLHDSIEINGIISTDTIFVHFNGESIIESPSYVVIVENYIRSCFKIDNTDTIAEIIENDFKVISPFPGDSLSLNDTFMSSNELFHLESYYYDEDVASSGDTTWINSTYYANDCLSNSIGSNFIYFAFKLTQEGEEKLGWLMLRLSGDGITVYESAIVE